MEDITEWKIRSDRCFPHCWNYKRNKKQWLIHPFAIDIVRFAFLLILFLSLSRYITSFLVPLPHFWSIIFITIVSYTFLYFSMRSTDNWILLPLQSTSRTLRRFNVLCWLLWLIVHGGELQWSDAKWWLAAFCCCWYWTIARTAIICT